MGERELAGARRAPVGGRLRVGGLRVGGLRVVVRVVVVRVVVRVVVVACLRSAIGVSARGAALAVEVVHGILGDVPREDAPGGADADEVAAENEEVRDGFGVALEGAQAVRPAAHRHVATHRREREIALGRERANVGGVAELRADHHQAELVAVVNLPSLTRADGDERLRAAALHREGRALGHVAQGAKRVKQRRRGGGWHGAPRRGGEGGGEGTV